MLGSQGLVVLMRHLTAVYDLGHLSVSRRGKPRAAPDPSKALGSSPTGC
jgi:hypothetical protein